MRQIGPYRVVRVVGEGAFGAVYEVEPPPGKSPHVALKLLVDVSPDSLERFEREAELLERLSPHPNIARILDRGADMGRPYVVLELIEGGRSLEETLLDRPIDRDKVIGVIATVARALHVAHEVGVVHRDVKPRNILLDPGGRPILTDFGLARARDARSLTTSGQSLGTVGYMAPEQVEAARDVDRRADVYALGAILYRALTGELPCPGPDATAFKRILVQEPRPPRQVDPTISPALEALCLGALSKDPGDRPATAELFAEELERSIAKSPRAKAAKPRSSAVVALGGLVVIFGVFIAREHARAANATERVKELEAKANALAADLAARAPKTESRDVPTLAAAALDCPPQAKDDAAALVERAYELDLAALAAHPKSTVLATLLRDGGIRKLDRRDVDSVRAGRRQVLRARLILPGDPWSDAADAIARAARPTTDALVHAAARPWRRASLNGQDELFFDERLAEPEQDLFATIHANRSSTWPEASTAILVQFGNAEPWRAVEVLAEFLLRRPRHPEIWEHLGHSFFALGRLAEARRAFEVATTIDRELNGGTEHTEDSALLLAAIAAFETPADPDRVRRETDRARDIAFRRAHEGSAPDTSEELARCFLQAQSLAGTDAEAASRALALYVSYERSDAGRALLIRAAIRAKAGASEAELRSVRDAAYRACLPPAEQRPR